MALSNAERQRRWREKHPEKRDERLAAFKAKKAQDKAEKAAATECDHEDRGVRIQITLIYCGRCQRGFPFSYEEFEEAHREWLSLPSQPGSLRGT